MVLLSLRTSEAFSKQFGCLIRQRTRLERLFHISSQTPLHVGWCFDPTEYANPSALVREASTAAVQAKVFIQQDMLIG